MGAGGGGGAGTMLKGPASLSRLRGSSSMTQPPRQPGSPAAYAAGMQVTQGAHVVAHGHTHVTQVAHSAPQGVLLPFPGEAVAAQHGQAGQVLRNGQLGGGGGGGGMAGVGPRGAGSVLATSSDPASSFSWSSQQALLKMNEYDDFLESLLGGDMEARLDAREDDVAAAAAAAAGGGWQQQQQQGAMAGLQQAGYSHAPAGCVGASSSVAGPQAEPLQAAAGHTASSAAGHAPALGLPPLLPADSTPRLAGCREEEHHVVLDVRETETEKTLRLFNEYKVLRWAVGLSVRVGSTSSVVPQRL